MCVCVWFTAIDLVADFLDRKVWLITSFNCQKLWGKKKKCKHAFGYRRCSLPLLNMFLHPFITFRWWFSSVTSVLTVINCVVWSREIWNISPINLTLWPRMRWLWHCWCQAKTSSVCCLIWCLVWAAGKGICFDHLSHSGKYTGCPRKKKKVQVSDVNYKHIYTNKRPLKPHYVHASMISRTHPAGLHFLQKLKDSNMAFEGEKKNL